VGVGGGLGPKRARKKGRTNGRGKKVKGRDIMEKKERQNMAPLGSKRRTRTNARKKIDKKKVY